MRYPAGQSFALKELDFKLKRYLNFNGGFYAPKSDMTFNGQLPTVTLLVVNSIRMNGGGITVPTTGLIQRAGYGVLAE